MVESEKEVKANQCPSCGNDDFENLMRGAKEGKNLKELLTIEYGDKEEYDDQVAIPFICKKCGFRGKEWYRLVFEGMTDKDNENFMRAE